MRKGLCVNSKEKAPDLTNPVKAAPSKKHYVQKNKALICHRNQAPQPPKRVENELTFWGVYNEALLTIQNERKWEDETCLTYDGRALKYLAHPFSEIAFSEWDEITFCEKWIQVSSTIASKTILDSCSVILREVLRYAMDKGLTSIDFYGMPEAIMATLAMESEKSNSKNTADLEIEKAVYSGTKMAIALPLDVELRVMREFFNQHWSIGELMVGLIMDACDLRTSEATGLSYKHLDKLGSHYILQTIDTSAASSRSTRSHGKTSNSPRFAYCPNWLANLILERKSHIMSCLQISEAEVDSLPICCHKQNYRMRCTQAEANTAIKKVFRKANVDKEVLTYAYELIFEDDFTKEDCEKKATAYILRKTAITAFVALGCSEEEIFQAAGHAMKEKREKNNFANPDIYEQFAVKLDQRPINRIFNQEMQLMHTYAKGTLIEKLYGTQSYRYEGSKPIIVSVDVTADEPHDHPLFEIVGGGHILHDLYNVRGVDIQSNAITSNLLTDISHFVSDEANTSYGNVCSAASDSDWINSLCSSADILIQQAKRPSHHANIPDISVAIPPHANGKSSHFVSPPKASQKASAQYMSPDKGVNIYASTSQNRLIPVVGPFKKGTTNQKGTYIHNLQKGEEVQTLIVQLVDTSYIALSKNGLGYLINAGTPLDEVFQSADSPELQSALLNGVLLPYNLLSEEDSFVAILSQKGKLACIDGAAMASLKQCGKQIVKPAIGDQIIAACVCSHSSSLILLSDQGHALRLDSNTLNVFKNDGVGMIGGLKLPDNASAVSIIPYNEQGYLIYTNDRNLIRSNPENKLPAHHRNSAGNKIVKLAESESRVCCAVQPSGNYVLMVNRKGYLLCVDLASIPTYKSACVQGITGQTQGYGTSMLCIPGSIVPLQAVQQPDSLAAQNVDC